MPSMYMLLGVIVAILWMGVYSLDAVGTQFSERDLYYFDDAKLIVPLKVASKISMRFLRELPEEERNEFLSSFASHGRASDPGDPDRIILEFVDANTERMMQHIARMNRSEIAEAVPVVLVGGREAIADGLMVAPKTPLTAHVLAARMKNYGEFTVRQSKQEQVAWLYLIDDLKPPLNIYLLANLISGDEWVAWARPHFRYIQAPVAAMMQVSPVSGTVDETRELTLSIRVFDTRVKMRLDLFPEFGPGKFMPEPAPQMLFFFPNVGERQPPQEHTDARGKIIVLRWKFRLLAAGEWTIPSQKVSYEFEGKETGVDTPSAAFVVTSLIGNLQIADMPAPMALVIPAYLKRETAVAHTVIQMPPHWMGRWVAHVPIASIFLWWMATISFAGAVVLVATRAVRAAHGEIMCELRMRALFRDWRKKCAHAAMEASRDSYLKLENVLWEMLTLAFPTILPPHSTWKDVEDDARHLIEPVTLRLIESTFDDLGEVYAPAFNPDPAVIARVRKSLECVMVALGPKIDQRGG